MAYANIDNWKPQDRKAALLDRAMEHVKSVPYKVSARWLYYRLFQEGVIPQKNSKTYSNFLSLTSRARHAAWNDWRPDTTSDETREAIHRAYGARNQTHAIQSFARELKFDVFFTFDHWYKQDRFVMIWFEARAMAEQFKYYTTTIDLYPMGGQPSIPYKYEIAKDIEWMRGKYGKPVTVLYFGDLDYAGETISNTVEDDVRKWCNVDFDVVWCGLTEEQVQRHGIPASAEKPGYQWESLTDAAAREIITGAVNEWVDKEAIDNARHAAEQLEQNVKVTLGDSLKRIADSLVEEYST